MSNKKTSFDILGESHIPTDLLTPTLGSNYGLDGFEDMQYGMGVLGGVLNPEYTEAPALPTGVQLASAEDLDLHGFLEEGVPLTDLSWLDPSQLQDPDRLPKDPDSIPELQEAWGKSTNGVRVWERDLDDATWQESLKGDSNKQAKLTPDRIRGIVAHAMRRSIQGQDINTILKEALESVGGEADTLAPYLQPMREEHGLHGKVFVRASAFPGWGKGKWSSEVRKWAPRAKYLVVSEHDLKTATWIEGGRCKYTSKIAVTEVPWGEALEHYKPLLESTGRKVAGADPKKALQAAFLAKPKQARPDTENRPVHTTPDQRVSRKEALEAFQNYTPKRAVYDPTVGNEKKAQKQAEDRVLGMAKRGLIPETEARALIASGGNGDILLQAAARIASRVKSGKYQGQEGTLEALQALRFAEADRKLKDSLESAARVANLDPSAEEYRVRVAKAENYIKGLTGRGLLSEKLATEILASKSDLQDKVRAAASLAFKVSSGEYRGDPNTLLGERALREARDSRRMAEANASGSRMNEYNKSRASSIIQGWVSAKKVSAERVRELSEKLGDPRKVAHVLIPEVAQVQFSLQGASLTVGGFNTKFGKEVGSLTKRSSQQLTQSQIEKELENSLLEKEAVQKSVDSSARARKFAGTYEAKVQAEVQKLTRKVAREIERGITGSSLSNFISRAVPRNYAPEVIRNLGLSLSQLQDGPREVRVYAQTQYSRVASEKQSKSVLAGQISKAANWVRRTMTEGFAGEDLSALIDKRLSDNLRRAADSQIQELRAAHEGASGFLYVDAEAYASPEGVTGCEQGALKHRSNKIPSVAEMPRCGTCAMVRVLEDGTRKCGVYNKAIVDYSGEDLTRVREANIRAANMNDVELTSSLFSPTYDPSEFGLENSNLEGISLELPETEKVSDVLFGGWDF